jgi:N-acetylglucosaminyldiphosphoundecaprenol N-acetyl-beta-D-mannosaminyltransferase
MSIVNFCNLQFRGLSREIIFNNFEDGNFTFVITVNSEFIIHANRDPSFQNLISNNFATFDGQLPYIIAKIKNRFLKFEKISGSDFIYDACHYARDNGLSIFLLGGHEESNLGSLVELRNKYKISIDGYSPAFSPYPFNKRHNKDILRKVAKFKPQILFVGFGSRKQEFWIEEHRSLLESIGVRMVVGCGGTFDFVSGRINRAPILWQRLGLEGVFRFLKEPKMFRFKRLLKSFLIFKYIW